MLNADAPNQSVLFPGIELRGKARRLPITDQPRPDCPKCKGDGIILEHSEWCNSETCEIMGMEGDCHGRRRKCKCWKIRRPAPPTPDPAAARPGYDRLIEDIDNDRAKLRQLKDQKIKNDLIFAVSRCDVRDRKRKGGRLAYDDGRDHLAGLVDSLCEAAAHLYCGPSSVNAFKILALIADAIKGFHASKDKDQ